MGHNRLKNDKIICVILCAGAGKRIKPYSQETSKPMIEIKGKPILYYIIDYWKKYTNNFIFVVGYKKESVIDYVSQLKINSQFIEQKELKGIADAISYVNDLISDKFIVALGDCITRGKFCIPEKMTHGIGVYKTKDTEEIKRNYSVIIENDVVCKVEEKPKEVLNNFCGIGVYFFNKKVFEYIERTKPSTLRNEKEITDVIQNMIDAGETIKPVFFNGEYLNVTFPEDIKKAEKII